MIDRIAYTAIRAFGALPLWLRRALGAGLGSLAGLIPSRERAVAYAQLNWILPQYRAHHIVAQVYRNIGRNIAESVNLQPILDHHESLILCDSWEVATSTLSEGHGAVCLSAHFGNWDLLGAWAVRKGLALNTVGREARNPVLQSLLKRLRSAYGIHTIWRSNRLGLKEIVERLKQGEVVAALVDQDTRVKSMFAPFFDINARTPSALVELAIRHRVPILAALIHREPGGKYRVHIQRLKQSQDAVAILSEYNEILATQIRQHPGQWVWFHKRWRSQADGAILRTQEYLQFISEQPSRAA
ncbi:MAG: lysophospholipid acyltransferase family protein [Oligoflexia bacterium]|nr:lysophospholipid acyltransferase family protein [Oligoflexia bacterium]